MVEFTYDWLRFEGYLGKVGQGNNRFECHMLALSRLFRLIRGNNMSEDSNVPIEQVNEMKERINVTLKRLRDELATYWTSTGEVPSFIIGKPAPILPQDVNGPVYGQALLGRGITLPLGPPACPPLAGDPLIVVVNYPGIG